MLARFCFDAIGSSRGHLCAGQHPHAERFQFGGRRSGKLFGQCRQNARWATTEVIGLGSVVELEDPVTGERLEVQVVSPAEASVLETPMKISDASPMGKALLGHREGDVLSLETPKGKKEFRVVSVRG